CPECESALSEPAAEPVAVPASAEETAEPLDADAAQDEASEDAPAAVEPESGSESEEPQDQPAEEEPQENSADDESEESQDQPEAEEPQEEPTDDEPQEDLVAEEPQEESDDEDTQVVPAQEVQEAFDPTPEPFVLLTSSAMNGIQQRCPHCGAVVYAGMRRCSRGGKRLALWEAEETEPAIKAAPLHEYKRFIGNGGAILVILLVLAGGFLVTQLLPQLIAPLFDDVPTIVGGQSIDHEINAYMEESGQEGEQEGESEAEAAQPALSPESLGQSWHGTYQGINGSDLVNRPIDLKINSVDNDGNVQATCVIGEEGYEGAIASYYVVGTIDWQTGAIELRGDEWIDSGELARMRMFRGTVDMDAGTISGTSSELDGTREGPWSMSLS
ncbi:MAG: hypothetical protein IJ092_13075, partial [Atopobiaceae bacterium]|nr:hypothetical protein [Atopobiaceae bacterium]